MTSVNKMTGSNMGHGSYCFLELNFVEIYNCPIFDLVRKNSHEVMDEPERQEGF